MYKVGGLGDVELARYETVQLPPTPTIKVSLYERLVYRYTLRMFGNNESKQSYSYINHFTSQLNLVYGVASIRKQLFAQVGPGHNDYSYTMHCSRLLRYIDTPGVHKEKPSLSG